MRLIALFFFCLAATNAAAADITTFVVQEALRADESGVARTSETVTVGLPLPEDGGFTNTSSFGITGSSVGQFKITGWWPNGNAKWVTVDLQTDLTADQVKTGFTLTDSGSGNFGGSNLATDNGSTITIATGTSSFTIKKANFNLFEAVTVGSTNIVTTSNSGGFELVDTANTVYSSVNDADSTATIEENGPVKTVITVDGALEDSSHNRFCDYQVRLTFYKNKSYVKGLVSLRNAAWGDYDTGKDFYSSELTVPLSIGTTKTVLLTDADTEYTRSLGSSDTAYVYQGHSSHPLLIPLETASNWVPPIPHTGTGYPWVLTPSYFGAELVVGAETIQALGTEGTWSQGYADLSDSNGEGLTVALKNMPQYYPAGFDIRGNGDVSIELFSKRNNNETLTLAWSKWESREVIWDFHDIANDKEEAFHALQHPLIARAPFEHYRTTKAFDTDKLTTVAEQNQFYSDEGETAPDLSNPTYSSDVVNKPWRGFFRVWARAVGGSSNFVDTAHTDLIDWVRTGHAGFYVFGSQRIFFDTYAGPRRSDDWTFEHDDAFATWDNDSNISGESFDMEHLFIQGIPWMYFLSGDPHYKTAMLEVGEWLHRMYIYGAVNATIPSTRYFRWWSRQAQGAAAAYNFTNTIGFGQSVYADDVAASFTVLIDSREDSAHIPDNDVAYYGRNMDRGFIYRDLLDRGDHNRVLHSFFHTQIHFNSAYLCMEAMKKWGYNYSRIEDFEDYLTGLSQFIYKEYVKCDDVIWGGKCGFEYDYRLYMTRAEVLAGGGTDTEIKPYSASRPYVWLRQKMGDNYQDTADQASTWSDQNERMSSNLQEQALIYQHIHNDIVPDVSITPSVVNNGGGSYTLSWTVPDGVNSYQIKYADKQIVDWLGYNRDTETYEYSPATYTPFFAATNVTGEPGASAEGTTESITITGLDTSDVYFAVKGVSTVATEYVEPTPATTYNFGWIINPGE